MIKTFIITGFLGAGKTTVLNSLLKQVGVKKNVVVENEFGETNIDKHLVENKFEQLYELTNGCICCTYDEGFYDLLNDLYPKRNEIDNLFIETTGIADVSPIIGIFNRKDVKNHFLLLNTLCVVDAEMLEEHLNEFVEVEKQIVMSDLILLNKTQRVHPTYLLDLQEKIKALNPFARILCTADGSVDFYLISSEAQSINTSLKHITHANHDSNHSAIVTHLFETEHFIDIKAFQATMSVTMLLYNHQIYRAKGFVRGHDGNTYLFQAAGKSVKLEPVVSKVVEKSQLVFIGKKVEYRSIERIMNQTIYKPHISKQHESGIHI